jgi:hypothetical protein
MGKVIDDLPDPQTSPASGAAQSADELLAQLASSEVDRLLAEAELERPVKPGAPPASASALALGMPPEPDLAMITRAGDPPVDATGADASAEALEQVDAETARQLGKLFDELQPGGPDPAAPPALHQQQTPPPGGGQSAAADPNLTAQLSDLFTQLTGQDDASVAAAFVDPDEEAGDFEGQVLASELLGAAEPLASAAGHAGDEPALPWYLKPLEWLNAPLAGCSDRARERLGKVAIVTLINALAVLLYVVLVRRR